jgi:hypothetical protein
LRVSISPPRVELAFGRGNLTWPPAVSYPWLAIGGLSGRAAAEDIRDVSAKSCVFVDWPRRRDGDRCGGGADAGTSGATDISARRRYYRGGGGAAAAGAFAAIVGTGLAIAATQNRRAYYDDYYGGGPVYYGGGPAYYGGGPYYYGGSPDYGGYANPNSGW